MSKTWTKVELALIKVAAFEIKYLRIPKALELRILKLVLRNRTVSAIEKKLRAALNG